MPNYETIREDSAFQTTTAAILPDNASGDITAQDARDLWATLRDRNKVKAITYSAGATLTIDLSVAPVQTIILDNNVTAVSFTNQPAFNLLAMSERLTDTVWETLASTTVAASNVEDPYGRSVADRLTMVAAGGTKLAQRFNAISGVTYRWQFYAKAASASAVSSFNIGFSDTAGGAINLGSSDESASSSWGFYETTWAADATATRWASIDNRANTMATDVYLSRMQLCEANGHSDYVETTVGPYGELSQVVLYLKQDATGSRTVAWGDRILWENSATPTLSTTANTTDAVTLVSDNGGVTWRGTFHGKGWPG